MQKQTRTLWLALGSTVLLACAGATAETYKWTDSEGKVHYSDTPPPSNARETTTVSPKKRSSRSGPAPQADTKATPAPAAKTAQELDAEFRERQVKAAEKEAGDKKKAAENEEKKKNCEQSKANLARLQDGGRIARYNDKGEAEYLSEAEIAQEVVRARQTVDSWCK
jgi:hypothetical protein